MIQVCGYEMRLFSLVVETVNTTALRVCEAFVASKSSEEFLNKPRPFIYISAEDIFRPVIPARYIETKREAERSIDQILHNKPAYRGVYIRPSAFPSFIPRAPFALRRRSGSP